MKIVTYLGFTLLSILIQFSVMDFIQDINKKSNNLNATTKKRKFKDVLNDFNNIPALYYQIKNEGLYSNSTTLPDIYFDNKTTTEITTTVFDILFDDNISTTEEASTTETFYTTIEYDNVTEITFFGTKNQTTSKPPTKIKKNNVQCSCNFMYKVCDINCCCDSDCTEEDLKLFPNCNENKSISIPNNDVCYSYLSYIGHGSAKNMFDNLFCIVKMNIPKTDITEPKKESLNMYYKWKTNQHRRIEWEFANKLYDFGDPVWLLKNGVIYYMDSPTQTVNSYCTGRKSIIFLRDEKYRCKVKFRDLEMFQFLNETFVISATPLSMNASILNCSTLHCVNWTIMICNNFECTKFNKSKHEPSCTESICTNLALDLDYIFYYHDTKIVNATIKFHVQNVSVSSYYVMQSIQVRFVMANESIDTILKLSGNPGYQERLPLIISNATQNYTESFFNKTQPRHFSLPKNEKGTCVISNITDNVLSYGTNKRTICKYYQKYKSLQNRTKECRIIQNNIIRFLKLHSNISISPLGNPETLKDKDWIQLQCLYNNTDIIYGSYNNKTSILDCYDIATRFSLIFSVANIQGNNTIIAAQCDYNMKNLSFSVEDSFIGVNLAVDISFVDITKPSVFEAATPELNLHIPQDFFYPFPSSESHKLYISKLTMLLNLVAIIFCK